MPKYGFQCRACGATVDVEADTGSEAEIPEHCGEPMKRLWCTTFLLKGPGWTRRPNDEIPTEDLPDVPDGHRSKRSG